MHIQTKLHLKVALKISICENNLTSYICIRVHVCVYAYVCVYVYVCTCIDNIYIYIYVYNMYMFFFFHHNYWSLYSVTYKLNSFVYLMYMYYY